MGKTEEVQTLSYLVIILVFSTIRRPQIAFPSPGSVSIRQEKLWPMQIRKQHPLICSTFFTLSCLSKYRVLVDDLWGTKWQDKNIWSDSANHWTEASVFTMRETSDINNLSERILHYPQKYHHKAWTEFTPWH